MADEPTKQYEYGLTPEEEGTEDAWRYRFPALIHAKHGLSKVLGALAPYRREIITPSETTYPPVPDSRFLQKQVSEPVYGEREFGWDYMPTRRGIASLGKGIKSLFTDSEARKNLLSGIASVPEALWQQQTLGSQALSEGADMMLDPETGEEFKFDPLLMIGPMAVAGNVFRPSGAFVGMFAGMKSPMADVDALKTAKKMEKAGTNRTEIWQDTGWWNDKGDWKFEISDEAARAIESGKLTNTVEDVLNHPELLRKAYPPVEGARNLLYYNRYNTASLEGGILRYQKEIAKLEKEKARIIQTNFSELIPLFVDIDYGSALGRQYRRGTTSFNMPPGTKMSKDALLKSADEAIGEYQVSIDRWAKELEELKLQPTHGGVGEIPVRSMASKRNLGEYWPDRDQIKLSTKLRNIDDHIPVNAGTELPLEVLRYDYTNTLLHEIQHAIQSRENWPRGGAPSEAAKRYRKIYLREFDKSLLNRKEELEKYFDYYKTPEKIRQVLWNHDRKYYLWHSNAAAREVAKRFAGEAESRLVQARRFMTNEERRRIPPWEMYDVPEEELIVRKGGYYKAAGGFVDKPLYERTL